MNHTRSNLSTVDFFGAPDIGLSAKKKGFFLVDRGNRPVTQRNAAGLLKRAYLRVVTLDTAENGFRACGIYPFNPPPLFSHLEILALYKFHFFQTQHQMKRQVHLFMQQRGNASPNCDAEPKDILSFYASREHPASRTPFKISRFPYNDKVHRHKQSWLTLRRLMSYIYIYIYIYIYEAPILDVSRSHTTTQHSR